MKMGMGGVRGRELLGVLFSVISTCCFPANSFGQTNLVSNGSFEIVGGPGLFVGWASSGIVGHINEQGADGRNFVDLYAGAWISQGIPTVPGRSYIVRFAHAYSASLAVRWNGQSIGEAGGSFPWAYTAFLTTPATGNVSQVEFRAVTSGARLDNVSVGWAEEPPSIQTQVPSRSIFEGGTVTFPVRALGGPALAYQWYFKSQPLSSATNGILAITNASRLDDGDYFVEITNAFGAVRSLPATLVVHEIPKSPVIVFQPKSLQMRQGYFAGFYVFAVGSTLLSYQWQFNGTNLTGATEAHFSIPAVDLSNAGPYRVVISNHFGTTLSLPADLSVVTGVGGGSVNWGNLTAGNQGMIDRPVFDVDGSTKLTGQNYQAQLYAGTAPNSLRAVGLPVPFGTGNLAGYYVPGTGRVPDVLAGQTAYLRVHVWDLQYGVTYEEARALGGRFGQSEMMSIVLASPLSPPKALNDLNSYSLQGGQPILATAKLYQGQQLPNGNREWILVGEAGSQYVVEQRIPPNNWLPLFVVTNSTGTVTFVDTNAQNSSLKFYRAQILEP